MNSNCLLFCVCVCGGGYKRRKNRIKWLLCVLLIFGLSTEVYQNIKLVCDLHSTIRKMSQAKLFSTVCQHYNTKITVMFFSHSTKNSPCQRHIQSQIGWVKWVAKLQRYLRRKKKTFSANRLITLRCLI